jgi:hypothetical protein
MDDKSVCFEKSPRNRAEMVFESVQFLILKTTQKYYGHKIGGICPPQADPDIH